MGLFDRGREQLKQSRYYDQQVIYSRHRVVLQSELPCKIAKSHTSTTEARWGWDTMSVHSYRVDFLIDAVKLGTVPEVGDVIDWGEKSFSVVEPAGETCWQFHDRLCTVYRIHAEICVKEIEPEPEPEPSSSVEGEQ